MRLILFIGARRQAGAGSPSPVEPQIKSERKSLVASGERTARSKPLNGVEKRRERKPSSIEKGDEREALAKASRSLS